MPLKAILFDLGDIFFEAHFWRKWLYERMIELRKFDGDFTAFYILWERYLLEVYEGKNDYLRTFENFINDLNVPEPVEFIKKALAKKKILEEKRVLFDGVQGTLQMLKKSGIQNIVVTDNELNENDIRAKILDKFNLNELIDKVFSSNEIGYSKTTDIYFL